MKTPFQRKQLEPPLDSSAARLLSLHDEIVTKWSERVTQMVGPGKRESQPIIINTLPAFLDNLAEALAPNYPREIATEGTTIASEHGGERARLTSFSASEVMREYQILREVLFETLEREKPLTDHEQLIIRRSVDQAMRESLSAFFLVHEGLREQFVATLTHDLRNPLTAIQSASDLILRQPELSEMSRRLSNSISKNVARADRMIRDLLDASRLRFGEKIHFEVEECELYSLARETIAKLAAVHGNRFSLEGFEIHGWWNRDAFERAIENLLTNALKYGDPKQPIRVTLNQVHGRAIVCVHNEGPPIPTEEQESIFRSFMRARSAQGGGRMGWGLGLAMVRGMAEGHGGSVTVDSFPQRGTSFTIDVPLDSRPELDKPRTPGT